MNRKISCLSSRVYCIRGAYKTLFIYITSATTLPIYFFQIPLSLSSPSFSHFQSTIGQRSPSTSSIWIYFELLLCTSVLLPYDRGVPIYLGSRLLFLPLPHGCYCRKFVFNLFLSPLAPSTHLKLALHILTFHYLNLSLSSRHSNVLCTVFPMLELTV